MINGFNINQTNEVIILQNIKHYPEMKGEIGEICGECGEYRAVALTKPDKDGYFKMSVYHFVPHYGRSYEDE